MRRSVSRRVLAAFPVAWVAFWIPQALGASVANEGVGASSEFTVPADKALVCIYRTKSLYASGVLMRVSLDGVTGLIGAGDHLLKVVEPGAHSIALELPPPQVDRITALIFTPKPTPPVNVSLEARAGDIYYLRASPEMGMSAAKISYRFNPPEIARNDIAQSHRSHWIAEMPVSSHASDPGAAPAVIVNSAPGTERRSGVPENKQAEIIALVMKASEALTSFTSLAAKGDVDGLMRTLLLPAGTDPAVVRANFVAQVLPFFSDFDRMGKPQVVHATNYAFLGNRDGVNFYVYAETAGGIRKPFVIGFIAEGSGTPVAYIDVGHCVVGGHDTCAQPAGT